MSNENLESSNDDDIEMLAAIKAAFGEEALGMISDESELESNNDPSNEKPLEELIREIDQATLHEDEQQQDATSTSSSSANSSNAEDIDKHIVVQIGDITFGIPMGNIHEIQRVPKITFLPGVPDWVLGVTNLRGDVVSVVDLRQLLDLPTSESKVVSRRLVMTHSLVDELATGLIVDRVIGIRNLRQEQVIKTSAPVNAQIARYLTGMVELEERLVTLLDIDKLLLSEDFRQFDAA